MHHLSELIQIIGYTFNEPKLLKTALTHRSVGPDNNERLEFLGDAVLSLIVSTALYQRHPHMNEGELSQLRSSIVNGDMLAEIAHDLGLMHYINLSPSEDKNGGKFRVSILGNTFEALIGAVYLDAGLSTTQDRVLAWYGERIQQWSTPQPPKDPKSRLQEWVQARQLPLPDYSATISGAPHSQTFTVSCSVPGLPYQSQGVGSTRRRAEQEAAIYFLEKIDD